MKIQTFLVTIIVLTSFQSVEAQFFKKLKKKAAEAAERTIERKVEEKAEKETEKAFDSIFNAENDRKPSENKQGQRQGEIQQKPDDLESNYRLGSNNTTSSIRRAKDFIPGDQIIFEDDFSNDAVGDFPAKWDTNSSGEVVDVNGQHYLKIESDALLFPMIKNPLPENYTIEFDMYAPNLDNNVSSLAFVNLYLADTPEYENGGNYVFTQINLVQYVAPSSYISRYENGKAILNNRNTKDYRALVKGHSHISIMANKTRFRLWIEDVKIIDVPRLIPKDLAAYFKIEGKKTSETEVYVSNFRIAQTGKDKRSALITEGKLSTNEILFESGSANIQKGGAGPIESIAKALIENPNVRIKVIGHTDSDGQTSTNLKLSKERAMSVKNVLIYKYDIDADRIETYGKGESEPVADNNTATGKAKNRRVEFIKL